MSIGRITVYSLYVMIWLIQNIYCRAGFCDPRKPVVKICTKDALLMQTSANIDTAEAPRFQRNSCKCTLSLTRGDDLFYFNYYRKPSANMEFKINDHLLDNDDVTRIYLVGDADLLFTTTENATDGACLIVSNEVSKFNLTCTSRTTKVTTGSSTSAEMKDVTGSGTFIHSTSTEIITGTTKQQHVETEDNGKAIILSTVIGALILIVGALILFIGLKRFWLTKEAKRNTLGVNHEVSPARQTERQGGQIQTGDFINVGVRVHAHALPYESLNMYVNNPLAGETYQQLDSLHTNENEQSVEITNIQPKQQSEDNINEGLHVDTDSQHYESLNMYENNNLAGETYQQPDSNRS